MSTGNPKRKRSERVASVALPPGQFWRVLHSLQRGDILLRIGIALAAAFLMWLLTGAWSIPFPYRTGYVPPRDIVARVQFSREDRERTDALRRQKRSETLMVYENHTQPLIQLQQALKDEVILMIGVESYEDLDEETRAMWRESLPAETDESVAFQDFRQTLQQDAQRNQFDDAVQKALADFERNGLLMNLDHSPAEGSHSAILVQVGDDERRRRVDVGEVRIGEVAGELESRLLQEFRKTDIPEPHVELVATMVYHWIRPRLPETLSYREELSRKLAAEAMARVEPVMRTYYPGVDTLVPAGAALTPEDVALLQREHQALISGMSAWQRLARSLADLGMYIALYVLCGVYVFFHERRLLTDLRRFVTIMALVVVTVGLCRLGSWDPWRVELLPLMLFGMTVAIAYERELALVLSAAVALAAIVSLGMGLVEFIIAVAAMAASILLLDRVRNRTKLINVGALSAVVVFFTTVGATTVLGQPFGFMQPEATPAGDNMVNDLEQLGVSFFRGSLLGYALWNGFCAILAGLVMTGLLPFIEKSFDVQTDLSLLELGDAAHPLLQELARRAPGTYNHSINVASLAEAAAESIRANGLLVRVGAYFHDIGKMLKPAYFVENQSDKGNQHESLLPAMSTLVIIAHVKDGADLARQHHLPKSMIDFIEQHHGTTLVEYFYRQAEKRSEQDPDGRSVDETNFRYPGPKPQTKEAAVLMLADAVESACRTLVDPGPARIESLVHDLAMRRLMDGQFDDCRLTLQDLATIEDALIKSLTAVYHGRVKYPGQQTA